MRPTFSELKSRALEALKGNWVNAILVCVIAGLLGGGGSGGGSAGGSSSFNNNNRGNGNFHVSDIDPAVIITIIVTIVIVMLIAIGIGLVISAFLGNVVNCGKCKYFMSQRLGCGAIGDLFNYFKGGVYMPVVKSLFMKQLIVALWSLLFVIPGIIAGYSYFMVDYIVAMNPTIDGKRAREISRSVMDGEKMNLFLLELSFIGWALLSILTCGLGVLALNPYIESTKAEYVDYLTSKAISNGIATAAELPGISAPVAEYDVPTM